MALTLADRAHKAATELTEFENYMNSKDVEALSPGEIEADNKRYSTLATDAMQAAKALADRQGTKASTEVINNVAKDFGLEVGEAKDAEGERSQRKSDETGIANPNVGMRSLGELWADSPVVKEMLAKGGNTSDRMEIVGDLLKGWRGGSARHRDEKGAMVDIGPNVKDLITVGPTATAGGGAHGDIMNPVTRLPGLTDDSEPYDFWLTAAANRVQVDTENFEWVEISDKRNNAAIVREAETAEDIGATSSVLTGNPVVTSILAGLKPESGADLVVRSERIKAIAHFYHITRFAANDSPRLVTEMNQFLRDGIQERREIEMLIGAGGDDNLRGILASGGEAWGIQTHSIGADTDLDGIAKAIAKVRRRNPNVIVCHPDDFYSSGLLLRTDANGNYQMGDPRSSLQQLQQLWGLRVRITENMPVGQYLIGNMSLVTLADRMTTQLFFTDAHKDLFTRNILTILAEERLAVALRNPQAFVHVTA